MRNWPAYDRALARRGDLTIWIVPETLEAWQGRGRRTYSDAAIEAALTVRAVFRLALRQTEGLVASTFRMLEVTIPVPDHTTLSRRGRHLAVDRRGDAGDGIDLVIDSTGLRLCRRSDGAPGRASWRKLHIAVDRLLVQRRQAVSLPQGVFRPRRPAVRTADRQDALGQRGRHIRFIAEHGWRSWEKASGYGRRNLVEATFSRLKRVFGRRLRGRTLSAQKAEAAIITRRARRLVPR